MGIYLASPLGHPERFLKRTMEILEVVDELRCVCTVPVYAPKYNLAFSYTVEAKLKRTQRNKIDVAARTIGEEFLDPYYPGWFACCCRTA